jgi:hypothetical protein
MPTVYTAQNAYDDAVAFSMNIAIPSASQIRMVDLLHSEIWIAYPWEWTLSTLTAIPLSDGVQDYALSGSDSTFRRLTKAWLTRTDTTPDQYFGPLAIRTWLPPELSVELTTRHQAIAYQRVATNLRLRLDYSVNLPSGVVVRIDGEFAANPTRITSLSTTFSWPDEFYPVLVNGLVYHIYRWSGDRRAGDVRVDRRGNRVYSGALAAYKDALQTMAASYDTADDIMIPEAPIGARDSLAPGLFS